MESNVMNNVPKLDDIVFENRNKEYGAYVLRKKYNRNMMWAIAFGIVILGSVVVTPYLMAKANERRFKKAEREVIAEMADVDQPDEEIAPPPPPPPPPAETTTVVKFVAPVVVDSIKPEEQTTIMTAEESIETTTDEDVTIVEEVREEVKDEAPTEVFVIVEEMPVFPGGDIELMKYIASHVEYPTLARENDIQGKVFIRFCVNYKGMVEQVSVIRSVDPLLDAEAVRVVKTLPAFKPGKQGGKPVNVWYSVPINFKLQ